MGMNSTLTDVIGAEIKLINRMFQENGIRAKVSVKRTAVIETGYISYGLQLAMDEKFSSVEKLQRELSNLLTNGRQRMGVRGAVVVIPSATPSLALEVPHPKPKTLLWSPRKVQTTQAHSMLVGRSYINAPRDEYIAFDSVPHTLIAGQTGAGKSVLLQTMLLSLCAGTSPEEVKLVLVDLKNEDLVPFECLPHVLRFAGTKADALEAIEMVVAEKDRRVANRGHKPYRLVLVIDEMAQLANDKAARDMLGDLASIGRSKAINLIGCTQHPTQEGGMGALMAANFTARLVGQVAPGQSYIATRRKETHADLLPGKGAFLRCQGPDVYRFQSFYIETGDVEGMARFIARDTWGGMAAPLAPVRREAARALVYAPPALPVAPVQNSACTATDPFSAPLSDKRPLSDKEAVQVQELYQRGLSKTALCERVYGSKSSRYFEWIGEALDRVIAADDGKVIRLRKVG